jgi:hypothetical protein
MATPILPTPGMTRPVTRAMRSLAVAAALAVGLAACRGGKDSSVPPVAAITAQPTDQSVVEGAAATFGVVASGATGYEWQRSTDGGASFAAVDGATAASHTTAATVLADSGTRYRVVVRGASNTVTSATVTLTVTAAPIAPVITGHPVSQRVVEGQDASFTVTAGGTSLAYQWQHSTDGGGTFTSLPGEAAATLTLRAVTLADSGRQLRVVVSNVAGSVTSDAASLTVDAAAAAPAFTTHPASLAVIAPRTATFTVVATGAPTPTLTWQSSADGGATFDDLASGTGSSSSYTTPATTLADSGRQYRVIATNAWGVATSDVATLTVEVASVLPRFTTQPVDVAVLDGQDASFTAAADGTPAPTLQWQRSVNAGATWSDIAGATGAVLGLAGVTVGSSGMQVRAVATNAAGSVASAVAVLTVSAAISGWGTAQLIETENHGAADGPQVAVNPDGHAFAVWYQFDGTATSVYANRYTPASGWSSAQRISDGNPAEVAQQPQIAVDAAGNAIAVWEQSSSTSSASDIWANRYTAGSGWGVAGMIESGFGNAGSPQVAVDPAGNAIAVWWQHAGGRMDVVASRFVPGVGWGAEGVIDTDAAGEGNAPRIAVDRSGNAIAIWPRVIDAGGFNYVYSVWANRYVAGTGWATAGPITASQIKHANPVPQVRFDANGNAIAVWEQFNDSGFVEIWSATLPAGGSWDAPAPVETDVTLSARDPQVAFDGLGNALAVWKQSDGLRDNVRSSRHTPAGGWGPSVLVETNDAGSVFEPNIVIDANGTATAVWSHRNVAGFTFDIWANRFTAATGWGSPLKINLAGEPARTPQLGVDASGQVVVVWTQTSGASADVWANHFR